MWLPWAPSDVGAILAADRTRGSANISAPCAISYDRPNTVARTRDPAVVPADFFQGSDPRTADISARGRAAGAVFHNAHLPDKLPCANGAKEDGLAIDFPKYVNGAAENSKNTVG
jgi:hypothetical protein